MGSTLECISYLRILTSEFSINWLLFQFNDNCLIVLINCCIRYSIRK